MSDKTALGDRMKPLKLQAAALFDTGRPVPEVAQALGVPLSTVYSWQVKWRDGGIERLTRWRWSHDHEPLNQQEAEVLQGLMLGDGCLIRQRKNPYLHITRTTRDMGYLEWTAQVFSSRLTASSLRSRNLTDGRTGKTYGSCHLRTRCDSAFLPEWERWYPEGKKTVPPDLVLSSVIVAVWLADDGSVTRSSRRTPEIKFATHGFQEPEVRRLAGLLSARYDGVFPVYEESGLGQYTIRAYGSPAKTLLRDIDPVFPPLGRKSDRWRYTELLVDRVPPPPCPRCTSERVYRWARRKNGVQSFKCRTCNRVFVESYTRPSFDPASPLYRELREARA